MKQFVQSVQFYTQDISIYLTIDEAVHTISAILGQKHQQFCASHNVTDTHILGEKQDLLQVTCNNHDIIVQEFNIIVVIMGRGKFARHIPKREDIWSLLHGATSRKSETTVTPPRGQRKGNTIRE
jgi:hypothetical protein